ncbi:syndecan-3 isoform X2 [Crotalus tigris]|uniref:syndecan-3 isoform X2 n=1 Tax=Crotalus tigris TaxID=88082 RepID=UPI00192F5495|nr:syndecan-3 isoform X2 [Crotalus tigris]
MSRLLPSRPRSQAGLPPPLLLLLLLAGHIARAQQWRNENFERPIDMEGSGDDYSFEDEELEEMEDFYSGSGSGYFKQDPESKTVVRLTTDSPILLATTSAVLPVTSVQPVATPLAPLPTEEVISNSATNGLYIPRISETPAVTIWKAVGVTATTAARDVTTTTTTTAAAATAAAAAASTMATTASTTTVTSKPTTALRDLLPVITIVAVTQSMMLETPTVARTEIPASPVGTSETKVRDTSQLSTSQEPDVTTMPQPPTATPTDAAQAEPMETSLPTVTVNELEVPISGDFEIHEEEVAQTELGNEVVPLVTPAAGPGLKKKMEPGLLDNTIESGNSAAQLPQKNILERKEVLIAVIVGGVVGALFATFLVMLLIYRMKKKDEGSYTLEEPKQASVTYQKPDKQEEFYA